MRAIRFALLFVTMGTCTPDGYEAPLLCYRLGPMLACVPLDFYEPEEEE